MSQPKDSVRLERSIFSGVSPQPLSIYPNPFPKARRSHSMQASTVCLQSWASLHLSLVLPTLHRWPLPLSASGAAGWGWTHSADPSQWSQSSPAHPRHHPCVLPRPGTGGTVTWPVTKGRDKKGSLWWVLRVARRLPCEFLLFATLGTSSKLKVHSNQL